MPQRFSPVLVQFGAGRLAVSLFGCAFGGSAYVACGWLLYRRGLHGHGLAAQRLKPMEKLARMLLDSFSRYVAHIFRGERSAAPLRLENVVRREMKSMLFQRAPGLTNVI